MEINYLKNDQINFVKWDNCINNAHNGSIYAFSWYLDIICENWEALVSKDYEFVMPILHKKRGNFHFTYNDFLSRQLGVFSTQLLNEEVVNAFLLKLSSVYKLFTINLNKYNKVKKSLFAQRIQQTYEFDLIWNYQTIQENYSHEVQEAIIQGKKHKISVIKNIRPNDFLELTREKSVRVSYPVKKGDMERLRKIIAFVYRHGLGEIYAAYTSENELCAACLFLKSNRKTNLIYSALTSTGEKHSAMHYLIDYYIKKHAEKILTLNFENLNVADKKKFCEGFGAETFYYVNVFNDKLSLPQKLLFRFLN